MIGYDLDGTIYRNGTIRVVDLTDAVVISGRTFVEYDDVARRVAQKCPVYIRGTGLYGDVAASGTFKALMVALLGVTVFYEDDPVQVEIIKQGNPDCEVVLVS